jgi:hypothetical protein
MFVDSLEIFGVVSADNSIKDSAILFARRNFIEQVRKAVPYFSDIFIP